MILTKYIRIFEHIEIEGLQLHDHLLGYCLSLFHSPPVSIQEAWNKERQALAEDSGSEGSRRMKFNEVQW